MLRDMTCCGAGEPAGKAAGAAHGSEHVSASAANVL